jgi:hypothetical protein
LVTNAWGTGVLHCLPQLLAPRVHLPSASDVEVR